MKALYYGTYCISFSGQHPDETVNEQMCKHKFTLKLTQVLQVIAVTLHKCSSESTWAERSLQVTFVIIIILFSIYSALKCSGCHSGVGAIIDSTPEHLDMLRGIFLLHKENINW